MRPDFAEEPAEAMMHDAGTEPGEDSGTSPFPLPIAELVQAGQAGSATAASHPTLDEAGLDLLFRSARTRWTWRTEEVEDDTLRRMYDLLKLGPTSANCSPARFLFLRTEGSKRRLRPALSAGNADKTMAAPVVAIVAHDPKFYEDLTRLYPGVDARGWFAGNDALATETAFRNGTLQGAYLIMAARAVGLSCGPMSGFDNDAVDREFLVAQGWKSNFLVALGHADPSGGGGRLPRLTFDEACRML